jgi:membrane protein implicated in regulation of membrane protease activity
MADTPSPVIRGVLYVSVWVLLWGTAASIVDAVLLGRGAYESGTTGQALTFASYAIASVVLAVRLSPRFLKGNDQQDGGSSDSGS